MSKSAAPTGLKIKKPGPSKFNCSWKAPKVGYGDGQQFKKVLTIKQTSKTSTSSGSNNAGVATGGTSSKSKTKTGDVVNISKNKHDHDINIDTSEYYPTTQNCFLTNIGFRVRGNSDPKKDSKKWSRWVSKGLPVKPPNKPYVSMELTDANRVIFQADIEGLNFDGLSVKDNYSEDKKTAYWGTHVETQTCLVFKSYSKHTDIPDSEWGPTPVDTDPAVQPGGSVQIGNLTRDTIYNTRTLNNRTSFPKIIQENDSRINTSEIATRWFRARMVGPGGASDWVPMHKAYQSSKGVSNLSCTITENSIGGYDCVATFDYQNSLNSPIEYIVVEYVITAPAADMMAPSSSNWAPAQIRGSHMWIPEVSTTPKSVSLPFQIAEKAAEGQYVFVRANAVYDGVDHYTSSTMCTDPDGNAPDSSEMLSAPSGLSVETVGTTNRISVTVTNNADQEDVFIVIKWLPEDGGDNAEDIGIILTEGTGEQDPVTIEIPPNYTKAYTIAAYAAIGDPGDPIRIGTVENGYNRYEPSCTMRSKLTVKGGNVPVPPSTINLEHLGNGNVRVKWSWDWKLASSAEIAWSDYENAIESTSPPTTYIVSNINVASIIVPGLEMGVPWYFWIRLMNGNTSSIWSNRVSILLNSEPNVAYFELSKEYITLNETFIARWAYITTDNSDQKMATISVGTYSGGVFTPTGSPYVVEGTEQYRIFDPGPDELNWSAGTTHYMSVKVTSESGLDSEEWAEPVEITVVEPITCEITNVTNITNGQLTALPFSVTVEGAGDTTRITNLYIERADDYDINRPDERVVDGYLGETVLSMSSEGDATFTIDQEDLYGYLDDGTEYVIIADVIDTYGQVATDEYLFEVNWLHQAVIPEAEVTPFDDLHAKIDIGYPEGAAEGDFCDIYRISVDNVQLIYSHAELNTTYIDPYPTIGEHGGHRVVFRTKNGDYTTADDRLAWSDYGIEEGDVITSDYNIIDFGTDRVMVMYNVDLDSNWNKDFQKTRYLAGSIQ